MRRHREDQRDGELPPLQIQRMDRIAWLRHGRSQRLRFREIARLRCEEGQRLRLWHGRGTPRDVEVRNRRHPALLPGRCQVPGAVRMSAPPHETKLTELELDQLNRIEDKIARVTATLMRVM